TDKLSFNTRGEYWELDAQGETVAGTGGTDTGIALTETVEYDLWANVISRLEVRYDKIMTGDWHQFAGYYTPSGANVSEPCTVGVYANIIYKF
ncbi:MAG TPA: outer membrane beta-barrel protein, partial [Verrucomicrobiae bacterium]